MPVETLELVDCEPEVEPALFDVVFPLPDVWGPWAVLGPLPAPVSAVFPPAPVGSALSSLQLAISVPDASVTRPAQRKESPNFMVLRR